MTANRPRVAVLYATAQGSTRDIAEYIAADLGERGADVELPNIEHAPDPSRFDTVIIGSAIHDMGFLPVAAAYVRNHHDALATTDVRLFSVGPGPALGGPVGRRLGRIVPAKIAAIRAWSAAIAHTLGLPRVKANVAHP